MGDPKSVRVVQAGDMTCYQIAPSPRRDDADTLRVGIVANEDSRLPLGETIAKAVRLASIQLYKLIGKRAELTELCYGRFGRYSATAPEASQPVPKNIMTHYLETTKADLPDYVFVLATDSASSSYGGYMLEPYGTTAPETEFLHVREPSFCQRISSEEYLHRPVIYGGVAQAVHPYGGCGYITGDDGEAHALETHSSDGACSGQDGLLCVVRKSDGTQHCPGSEREPQSTIEGMMAGTMVHELGHAFGSEGNNDHVGIRCEDRGGLPPGITLSDGDRSAQICPDVWERARAGGMTCLLPAGLEPQE